MTSVSRPHAGFSLTELAVVLVIVALLIGGMLLPLTTQYDLRYVAETQKTLSNIREALLGYAAANGRLPCPASAASNGVESFAAGGDASNGNCSNFYDGFLPAVTLGISPTDQNGYALDAWSQRIRYAVYTDGTNHYLTRTDGIKTATMASISAGSAIAVCATATGIAAASCNTAQPLTTNAPAVFFSLGKNAATGGTGTDEAANLNNDAVFIYHDPTPSSVANGEFDDIVSWLSLNILYNRMIAAGKLP
jgi:prepilin-type N-terminal cleavage/methylation domain-containing protein